MKTYAFTTILILFVNYSIFGDIINGFTYKTESLRQEIAQIILARDGATSDKTKSQLNRKLKKLQKNYSKLYKCYIETEQLLAEFRYIEPLLFNEVSNVRNAEGTITNVYIRYVNFSSAESKYLYPNYPDALSYTCVRNDKQHKNTCISPYGTNTITVIIGKRGDELVALAHEFGHVLYIVPNISEYANFLYTHSDKLCKIYGNGHCHLDPSYTFIKNVEAAFMDKYALYRKESKWPNRTNLTYQ